MEELLNKLIEKGWKPFGIEYPIHIDYYEFNDVSLYRIETTIGGKEVLGRRISHSLRDIASAESGLWQFVCENGMIKITEENSLCNWLFGENIYYDETHTEKLYKNDNYQYRLIESALKDESELERFLLDNIKV